MVKTLKKNLNLKDKTSEKIYTINELLDLHPRLTDIWNFTDGVAIFKARGNKQWIINENWKILTKDSYQFLHNFKDWLAVFRKWLKWGWLTKDWDELNFWSTELSYASDFYKWYSIFIDSNDGKRWCIDKNWLIILNWFNLLADIEDDWFMRFEKNWIAWWINPIVKDWFCQYEQRLSEWVNKWFISSSLINNDTSKWIVFDWYTRILDRFHNGYAFVEKNWKLCHLDTKWREFYQVEKDWEIFLDYKWKLLNRKIILG